MTRTVPMALTLIACLWAGTAHAVQGTWTAKVDGMRADRIYLALRYSGTNNMDFTHDVSVLTGLAAEAVRARTSTPVSFALDREAGRVSFEGSFENGKGSGHFTFEPNAGYLDKVRALGVDVSRRNSDPPWRGDERLLFLALIDVSTDYIRSMIAEGYEVTLEDYQEMRLFEVTPAHVREMRSLGFDHISARELVATRIHGITPEYVREMRAAGWDLSLSELQSARIFNVTPELREEMAKLGYRVSIDKLIAFRVHGVTPEWIAEQRSLGYGELSADDLVSMRIFNVTPEFREEMAKLGYRVSVDKLTAFRIHGVTPEWIEELKKLGYAHLSADDLISMKIHGVRRRAI